MTRDKLILGGFEQWVEYDQRKSCITLFGFETAQHGLILDVMGKHVNGFIGLASPYSGGSIRLTKQEESEINQYILQKSLEVTK